MVCVLFNNIIGGGVATYSTKDFERMSPMELGETGRIKALPYVIKYLNKGGSNEVRLAASAIRKIATKDKNRCLIAIPHLINALDNDGPQARQYVLSTLLELNGVEVQAYKDRLEQIIRRDPKSYNREAAEKILIGKITKIEATIKSPILRSKPQAA